MKGDGYHLFILRSNSIPGLITKFSAISELLEDDITQIKSLESRLKAKKKPEKVVIDNGFLDNLEIAYLLNRYSKI